MACCLADALQVPRVSNHVGVITLERHDQGHLHPKLEVPGLTSAGIRTRASCVGGEHSRQLVDSYSELQHMSPQQNKTIRNLNQLNSAAIKPQIRYRTVLLQLHKQKIGIATGEEAIHLLYY
jgi:hypothetical protein